MKTLFEIHADNNENNDILLLELGPDHCCIALVNEEPKKINSLKYVETGEYDLGNTVSKALEEYSGMNFKKVLVCTAFPYSILTPQKYFQKDFTFFDNLFELHEQEYFYDQVPEWQLTNVYSIDDKTSSLIRSIFPLAKFIHAYTPELKIYNGFSAEDQISINFSPRYFRVVLKKAGHLQLAQTYPYKTPMDVTYFLLKICYEFHLNQMKIFLILSGLIEKDSALYKELHNYFLNIHFAKAQLPMKESDHPAHFFTSLHNLAACVS